MSIGHCIVLGIAECWTLMSVEHCLVSDIAGCLT